MRGTILLIATMALTLLVASGVALAVTRVGGPANEVLRGTDGPDELLGNGGNDTRHGLGGNDNLKSEGILVGGAGDDKIFGGPRSDDIWGGLHPSTLTPPHSRHCIFMRHH